MNQISFLNRSYAFKGLLAVKNRSTGQPGVSDQVPHKSACTVTEAG